MLVPSACVYTFCEQATALSGSFLTQFPCTPANEICDNYVVHHRPGWPTKPSLPAWPCITMKSKAVDPWDGGEEKLLRKPANARGTLRAC